MKSLLLLLILIAACTQPGKEPEPPKDLSSQTAREIRAADSAMNVLASQQGFNAALLAYADDNLIKPENNSMPIVGKKALEEHYKGEPGTKEITWGPFHAVGAASGDIGYTLGNWKFANADTTMYGLYYTMWKKQADGSWKWTVDGGNNMPGEFRMPQ